MRARRAFATVASGCALAAMVVSGCGRASEGTLRVGLLADCVGNLSGVQESAFAGAELPLIRLGARLAGTRPSQGLPAPRIAAHPLPALVGCSATRQYP